MSALAQRVSAIALCALVFAAPAYAADVPLLSGRVVDNAEILKPATRDRIAAALKAQEDATGNQIAVLTVPTIGGDSVEEYATKVFESWKLGKKGKDDGVLVVVVPNDRKMRIEVGYGLEGTLTDVAAARIIRNAMTPQFKAGDYDKGVEDGVTAIIATLQGKAGVAAEPAAAGGAKSFFESGAGIPFPMNLLVGAFVFGIIGLFTFIGIMTPGVGWFLYAFLIPFWAMFPLFIIGAKPTIVLLAVYLIGYPIAKVMLGRQPWYQKAAADLKKTGTANIGGFIVSSGGGSGSSSSSWSSGSSGGGFSGGGGSSDGGGASGSW
ncbi:MAG: TPM domain-containing protein [Betaproteobacteria bacterium]